MIATRIDYNPLINLGKSHDITDFRDNQALKAFVENVTKKLAMEYIPYIDTENPLLEKILDNLDTFGKVSKEEFIINNKTYSLSPTTIRYLGYAGMMKELLKKSTKVIEIGGGYGGQAQVILNLYPNINSYQIVDLEDVKKLQKDYLINTLPISLFSKVSFANTCDKSYDLLIANYSLAEFSAPIVQEYMKYLRASKYGFIIWNTTNAIPIEITSLKNFTKTLNDPDIRGTDWKNIYKITYNQENTPLPIDPFFADFDEIISLGYNCFNADVFRKLNLRKIAYPFDWIISNLSFIKDCIKNPDYFPFVSPTTLEYIKFAEEHYYYTTKDKNVVSLHDFFSEDKNSPINNKVYEKYARRLARFKEALKSDRKILFVRMAKFPFDLDKDMGITPERDTPEKVGELADLITQYYPNLNFRILFTCDRGDVGNQPIKYFHPKMFIRARYLCEVMDHHLFDILKQKEKPKEKFVSGRVSVIIPTFNRGYELLRAVSSALNNTHPDVEVLVIDDCSTDPRSIEIINSLKQQGIMVLKTSKNSRNPAIPRNLGMAKATGEWIAFLDDDDEFLPNKLEYQINTMKFSNSLFSCSDAYYSKTINHYDPRLKYEMFHQGLYVNLMKKLLGTDIFPSSLDKKELIVHNWIVASGVMIHSSLLDKVGKFITACETAEGWEDYNYWLGVLDYTNSVTMINTPLIFFNMVPRSEKWYKK